MADRRRDTLRFLVVFAAVTGGAFLALQGAWVAPLLWQVKIHTAEIVAGALARLGTPAVADGAHVRFAGTWIQIIDECTGVYAIVLLVAFLVAFPQSWRRRAAAIGVGVALVSVLNLVRLVALALLMVHRPGAVDLAHDYLWQVLWAGALVTFALLVVRRPAAAA